MPLQAQPKSIAAVLRGSLLLRLVRHTQYARHEVCLHCSTEGVPDSDCPKLNLTINGQHQHSGWPRVLVNKMRTNSKFCDSPSDGRVSPLFFKDYRNESLLDP